MSNQIDTLRHTCPDKTSRVRGDCTPDGVRWAEMGKKNLVEVS